MRRLPFLLHPARPAPADRRVPAPEDIRIGSSGVADGDGGWTPAARGGAAAHWILGPSEGDELGLRPNGSRSSGLSGFDWAGFQCSKKKSLSGSKEEEANRVPLGGRRTAMAARGTTSAPAKEADKKVELMKEVRAHEVAISELESLPPSRPVYQKTGNLFFRKSVKSVVRAEQKQLDLARDRLNKLDQA